jgi:hypothetical protein
MVKSILEEIAEENVARDMRLNELIKPLLEPEVLEAYLTDAANLSLAISLKRIADALTWQPDGVDNLYDFLQRLQR